MKTTLELTYKELQLISEMARIYTKHLDEHIEFNKKMNLPTDWSENQVDKVYDFWAKIETAKMKMTRGTK